MFTSFARADAKDDRATPVPACDRPFFVDIVVTVIIANCVINLSVDEDAVLREAFRVLKPNGRFAVSDLVFRGEVPAAVRRSMEFWVG